MTELQWKVANVLFNNRFPTSARDVAIEMGVPAKTLGAVFAALHNKRLILRDANGY